MFTHYGSQLASYEVVVVFTIDRHCEALRDRVVNYLPQGLYQLTFTAFIPLFPVSEIGLGIIGKKLRSMEFVEFVFCLGSFPFRVEIFPTVFLRNPATNSHRRSASVAPAVV